MRTRCPGRALLLALSLAATASVAPAQLDFVPRGQFSGREYTDAATDTWRSRVVVFGGRTGANDFGDTWEFDGAAWNLRRPLVSPTARHGHALAFDSVRGRVVLFGGFSNASGQYRADTWEWTGRIWRQIRPTTSPPARAFHSMAFDPLRARVVLFGGRDGGGRLGDTWEWDGVDWTPVSTGSSPSARHGTGLAFDPRTRAVLLFGGNDGRVKNDTWTFDGTTWNELSPATSPPTRFQHGLALDPITSGGRVVLFGGDFRRNDVWTWNGTTWSLQSPGGDVPNGRQRHVLAFDVNSGAMITSAGDRSQKETYSLENNAWTRILPAPGGIERGAMAHDPVSGDTIQHGGLQGPFQSTTWAWDGATWRTTAGTTPINRHDHSLTASSEPGAGLILFGGWNSATGGFQDATYRYAPTGWVQLNPAQSPPARSRHAACAGNGTTGVLVFGGTGGGLRNDTWRFANGSWNQVMPTTSPTARESAAMAGDGSQVVLFGGANSGLLNDTWVFDGADWTQVFPAVAPSPRRDHRMVYDADRDRILLIGGDLGGNRYSAEVWAWDATATNWVLCQDGPFAGHANAHVAFESTRDELVLFGGRGAFVVYDDTFTAASRQAAPVSSVGSGCPAPNGTTPSLAGTSTGTSLGNPGALIGSTFDLRATSMQPGGSPFAGFVVAANLAASSTPLCPTAPAGGCRVYPDLASAITLSVPKLGPNATLSLPIPAAPPLVGVTLHAQAFGISPGGACLGGVYSTNALSFTIGRK